MAGNGNAERHPGRMVVVAQSGRTSSQCHPGSRSLASVKLHRKDLPPFCFAPPGIWARRSFGSRV